jgi:hypothetical protein
MDGGADADLAAAFERAVHIGGGSGSTSRRRGELAAGEGGGASASARTRSASLHEGPEVASAPRRASAGTQPAATASAGRAGDPAPSRRPSRGAAAEPVTLESSGRRRVDSIIGANTLTLVPTAARGVAAAAAYQLDVISNSAAVAAFGSERALFYMAEVLGRQGLRQAYLEHSLHNCSAAFVTRVRGALAGEGMTDVAAVAFVRVHKAALSVGEGGRASRGRAPLEPQPLFAHLPAVVAHRDHKRSGALCILGAMAATARLGLAYLLLDSPPGMDRGYYAAVFGFSPVPDALARALEAAEQAGEDVPEVHHDHVRMWWVPPSSSSPLLAVGAAGSCQLPPKGVDTMAEMAGHGVLPCWVAAALANCVPRERRPEVAVVSGRGVAAPPGSSEAEVVAAFAADARGHTVAGAGRAPVRRARQSLP